MPHVAELFRWVTQQGDDIAHRHNVALARHLLEQRPRFERFEFNRCFVRFDLRKDVAPGDDVADVLQPVQKSAFGHIGAHLGHGYFEGHGTTPRDGLRLEHLEDGIDDVLFGRQRGELQIAIVG